MPTIEEDTITLKLSAEKTVTNTTAKVLAELTGMITRDRTEAEVKKLIHTVARKLIPTDDWQFANINRTAHPSGYEQITLIASVRVPEAENRALDKRRQEASRPDEGLTITRVSVDLSFPTSLIETTERELRLNVIAKALDEAKVLGDALGRTYRIKTINFDDDDDGRNYKISNRMSSDCGATKTPYGSGFRDDDVLGNAQKLTLTAVVTLAVAG